MGVHWRGRPPLYGAYDVETFVRGRDTNPPLLTDTTRWSQLTLAPSVDPLMRTGNAYGAIFFAREIRSLAFQIDSVQKRLTVLSFNNPELHEEWSYLTPDEGHVLLRGVTNRAGTDTVPRLVGERWRDSLSVTLRRIDLGAMPLLRPQLSWK